MTASIDENEPGLLDHVLVPVANESDGRRTAQALAAYTPDRVTALHVIEKGEGVPDKKPLAQSEQLADASFAAFRELFPSADVHTANRRDIVDAILDVSEEV